MRNSTRSRPKVKAAQIAPDAPYVADEKRDTCKIPDCKNEHYAKGWCQKHYRNNSRHGHPLGSKQRETSQ